MVNGVVDVDQMEQFLSTELSTSSLRNTLRYYSHTKETLERFQSSSCYEEMRNSIGFIPIENLKNNSVILSQTKSFSLFDFHFSNSAGTSLLHQSPPNIRDILEETDRSILLYKCLNTRLEDLILGFNTTEEEVKLLGDLLYQQLLTEESAKGNSQDMEQDYSSSFMQVHFNWLDQSISQAECVFFGFILSRNMMLVHLNIHGLSETNLQQHAKFTSALMKILYKQMNVWNDTNTFQNPWLEIVYILFIAFREGHESKKNSNLDFYTIWAKQELVHGRMLERIMACVSSWSDVIFLLHDTGFMAYLMRVTIEPTKNEDGNIRSNHSHSILRYILIHTSTWMFPHPQDESSFLEGNSVITEISLTDLVDINARITNRYTWIENKVSHIGTILPSPEMIFMLLKPFLHSKNDMDENARVCIHVLHSCCKNATLLDQVLILAFPNHDQRMDRETLTSILYSKINILDSTSEVQKIQQIIKSMI